MVSLGTPRDPTPGFAEIGGKSTARYILSVNTHAAGAGARIGRALAALATVACLTQCSGNSEPGDSAASSAPAAAETVVTSTPPPRVSTVTAAELGDSWRPGCPVGPDQLRRVEIDYIDPKGQSQRGYLIVHRDIVDQVQQIFGRLREMAFPITKMEPAQHYPGADDELSMEADNTSAFNCRGIPGSRSWSQHAYGRAVDINPLINPMVNLGGSYEPSNAEPYLDRTRKDPGMLHAGDPAVRAFTDRGWTWGGDWRSPKDYQHFELPGH